MVGFDPGIS